jgi:ATP-dependent 26S proteasome regulatory subunit
VSTTTASIDAAVNAVNAERRAAAWYEIMMRRFLGGESHTFLPHGNIFDFVRPGWSLQEWLTAQFIGPPEDPKRDVIMTIGVDRITFPNDRMRRLFEATLGLELPSDPDERAASVAPGQPWEEAAPNDVPLPTEPSAMLELALRFLKLARYNDPDDPASGSLVPGGARSAALIVSRVDLMVPKQDKGIMVATPQQLKLLEMLENASTDPDLEYAQNPIVLLAPKVSEVHPDVAQASGLRQVRVPLPDYAERLEFIRDLMELKPWLRMDISPEKFAALTAGQNRRDIEDITLRAGDGTLDEKLVLTRGQELMDVRYGSVLKRLNPSFGFDGIGGNANLLALLRRDVVEPMRAGQRKGVPMGVALLGPPGTGKSAIAMAAAFETGINAIQIKNFKDKWVGSTEQNLEDLIEGAEMFAPTFVFIDEYDKAFGSGSGDDQHPVDQAVQKRMQEWLGEESHRGWIFLMAASNYPEAVPPELMRTGRIDIKAPILAPETEEERVDILHRLLVRYGHADVPLASLLEFGEPTEGWVGSDLEFAVSQATGAVERRNENILDALRAAIEDVIPADNLKIRAQEQAALKACNLNSLLPRRERERRRQQRQGGGSDGSLGPGRIRQARRNDDGPVL